MQHKKKQAVQAV